MGLGLAFHKIIPASVVFSTWHSAHTHTHTQQLAHHLPCCKFPLAYPIPQNKNQKKKKEKKRKFKKKQNILNAVLLSECHLACNFFDARRRRSGSGCLQTERLLLVSRQQLAGERL
jgi:hypothetical protein